MLDTRERKREQVNYMAGYSSNAMRPYDYACEENKRQVYPSDRRVTSEQRYSAYYEDSMAMDDAISGVNYGVNTNDNSEFKAFDYNEVVAENKKYDNNDHIFAPAKKQSKCSVKFKVLVGVYFALITLIVVMLLVNTIPSISAGGKDMTESVPEIVVNEQGYNASLSEVANGNQVSTVAPYEYDTNTNWFDKFCDYLVEIFG